MNLDDLNEKCTSTDDKLANSNRQIDQKIRELEGLL